MNNQINTKTLKARLKLPDYEKLFKALNIPIYTKGHKYWSLYTACHNRDPYKGSPKLLFYHETGMFQCLTQCSCSFDIIALAQKRLKLLSKPCAFLDAVNFIIETTGLEIDTVKRINKPNLCDWSGLEKFVRFRSTGSTLEPYDKSILEQLEHSVPQQWLDEGISVNTMVKYQIGYYDRLNATTIPCFAQDGSLIGIRCRHWRPDEIEAGKYRPLSLLDGTTYKFPTNQVFYGINWNWGEIERTGHVILVEGEKSVLKADTMWGEKSNVLALYGNNLGLQRRNQLIKLGVDHVTIALDSDFHEISDEGYNKFEQKVLAMAKLFKGYAKVDVVYNNIGLQDAYKASPFDFDEATYNLLWENREAVE